MTTTFSPPNLNQVPEESSGGGVTTPSHDGTVLGGHGFDLPIAQAQQRSSSGSNTTAMPSTPQQPRSAQLPTARDQLYPMPAPIPRSGTSNRPRPVSMPPQAFSTTVAAASNGSTDKEQRPVEEPKQRHVPSTSRSGRSSNRILGDYTLSKTLGAGSMGKVKLATHNVTGEKVRLSGGSHLMPFLTTELPAGCQNPATRLPDAD